MWEAMGSVGNPSPLVNAEAGFNGIKMRVWRGIDPVSDKTWLERDWDNTSADRGPPLAEDALSTIREVIAVFNYLNHQTVEANRASVFNKQAEVLREYDAAVARVRGVNIQTERLHREFTFMYLTQRIEDVSHWVNRRLERLESNWQARVDEYQRNPPPRPGTLELALSILESVDDLKNSADDEIMVKTGKLTPGPPTPESPPSSPGSDSKVRRGVEVGGF